MASPYPNGYKRMGNVGIPSEDDLVEIRRQGRDTIMNFGGAEPARVGGGDLMQGLRELLLAKPQPQPQQPIAPTGLQPLEMAYDQDYQIPSFDQPQVKSPRPPQSYGLNRGGTGSAGRKTSEPQFGQSQFDLGPQFSQPEDEMSIADLRELDDKPWELDPNTNADVASGTKLDVEPEKPDLSTRQGLYDALSQRYPNMLQKNLDYLDQAQIKPEELESLGDRAGMGSLFIAASKAASGAGTVGGKSPESIAKGIVEREDTLARQRLKDRLDVASTNLSMNAKAVDLAMKQIDFADEREQYDPNSEVSRFARDFMRSEFDVNVPDNVPAYQLKQFLPAVVQKYQAQERARYQSALLGQRTAEQELNEAFRQLKLAQEKGDREAERQLRMDIAQLKAQADKEKRETPKPVLSEAEKIRNDLVKDDAKVYQKRLQGLQKLDGALQIITKTKDQAEIVRQGQSLLKTLNDTENSDAVGAEEVKRLASELQNFAVMTPDKWIQIGRDLPGFIDRVKTLRDRLYNTAKLQYDAINKKMPDVVDAPPTYEALTGETPATLPSGKRPLTPEERQKLQRYREMKGNK